MLNKRAERRARELEEVQRERAVEKRRFEKARRRNGKSELALELELLSLSDIDAARRRQQLAKEGIQVHVHEEWQQKWEQQQAAFADAHHTPSFANMVLKGYSASGPALGASPPLRCRSPDAGPACPSPDFGSGRSPQFGTMCGSTRPPT